MSLIYKHIYCESQVIAKCFQDVTSNSSSFSSSIGSRSFLTISRAFLSHCLFFSIAALTCSWLVDVNKPGNFTKKTSFNWELTSFAPTSVWPPTSCFAVTWIVAMANVDDSPWLLNLTIRWIELPSKCEQKHRKLVEISPQKVSFQNDC